jgi:hypothetical protein
MSERAGKFSLVLSVLTLLAVGFLTYRSYYPFAFSGGYNPSGEQVTTDLLGKSVTLPQGQIWGFNPDQSLKVDVKGQRQIDSDTVILTTDVTAVVRFPPPKKDASPKAGDPTQPTKATLSGLAKVYYERHAGHWYLTNVEGIKLEVVPE